MRQSNAVGLEREKLKSKLLPTPHQGTHQKRSNILKWLQKKVYVDCILHYIKYYK